MENGWFVVENYPFCSGTRGYCGRSYFMGEWWMIYSGTI
jgi:hypothetical protein